MTNSTPSRQRSLLQPDQGDAEDVQRRRRFGLLATSASIVVSLIVLPNLLLRSNINPVVIGSTTVTVLIGLGLLLLIRRGYVTLANSLGTLTTTTTLFIGAHLGDGVYGTTAPFMLAAVAFSAFLVPRLLFIINIVLVTTAYMLLAYLEISGQFPPYNSRIEPQRVAGTYVIAFILVGIGMAYFSRGLSNTVRRLLDRSGELGAANQQLTTQQQLRETAAGQVVAESDTVAQLTREQLARLQQAVSAFQQTQVSAEQLSQIAAQIAAAAGQVQAAAAGTLQQTARTQAQVTVSVGNIEQLFGQVNQIAAVAAELAVSSRNIEQVVATIQSLADEVRLLSLNAAIEAAGAGEYGRRFSVIADEVRGLSDAAEVATRQVGQQIGAVLTAIQQVASASQQGIALVNQSQSQLATISAATQQINSFSSQTSQLADQIRLTTDQQRQASQEMAAQMHSVTQLASLEASSAAAGAEAAARLREVASQLARPN